MKKNNWYNTLLHFMLIAFAVIIVLLIKKNQSLEEKLAMDMIKKGDKIWNLSALNIDSSKEYIRFDEKTESVLFVFSTTCPYCLKNISIWKEMYNNYKHNNNYKIIGIACDSLEKVKEYVSKNNIPYKVIIPVDKDFRKKYKINGVPATLRVKNNEVTEAKIGLLEEKINL